MNLLVTVIFTMCLQPGASDYDWACVDFLNNCAADETGEIKHDKIKKCLIYFKKGEKYEEPK